MFCLLCNSIQAKVSNELSLPKDSSQDMSHCVQPPGTVRPSPELWGDVLPLRSVCCSDVQAGVPKPQDKHCSPAQSTGDVHIPSLLIFTEGDISLLPSSHWEEEVWSPVCPCGSHRHQNLSETLKCSAFDFAGQLCAGSAALPFTLQAETSLL